MHEVVCVDIGSTYTKAAVVDVHDGRLLRSAEHRTTVTTDVADGVDAVRGQLGSAHAGTSVLMCSSAGGGLRLAVVGHERAVTAEAGRRVGLSAGARVEHIAAGRLDASGLDALLTARPDVVLLVGGTDGGNAEVLLHNARVLGSRPGGAVVLAGNADAATDAQHMLCDGGWTVRVTGNVLPRIGVLDPGPARSAIRATFIEHVIGGKKMSKRLDLAALVKAATPDAVLTGVALLSQLVGDVVLVDVGGATTDVYSVLAPDGDDGGGDDVAGDNWHSRSVEGDLGMRWNAPGVVEAAGAERLVRDVEAAALRAAAAARASEPGWLPATAREQEAELRLAQLAVTVALRRHARADTSRPVRRPGKDLRRVRTVVASGGVFRHADDGAVRDALSTAVADPAGGWRHPEHATVVVDRDYVLAPAGLLAAEHPSAARALLRAAFP